MRLSHYGHACVLVETDRDGRTKRVLIDPGTYSHDFEDLPDIDLVLVTHAHPDHLDTDRLRQVLRNNPQASVIHGPDATEALAGLPATAVRPGDQLSVDGVDIVVTGTGEHARIDPELPRSDNNGYLIDGVALHPGDALEAPSGPVDVVFVPVGGPWMKLGESIAYLRTVTPKVAVPIHQAGLAEVHQRMHHQLLTRLAPSGTRVVLLDHAVPHEL